MLSGKNNIAVVIMDGILGYLKAVDYLPELEGRIVLVKSDLNVPFISGDDQPPRLLIHSGSFRQRHLSGN